MFVYPLSNEQGLLIIVGNLECGIGGPQKAFFGHFSPAFVHFLPFLG